MRRIIVFLLGAALCVSATTVAQAENVRVGIVKGTNVGVHHGGHDYHDAFSGPNEERKDGPTAAATEDLLAKSADQPLDQIRLSISYLDPERRLDTPLPLP